MPEHRAQFTFTEKREYIAKVNIPNLANPNQYVDIEISYGSRDHAIVPDTVKITFNLDIESTGKARSIVNNVVEHLRKKGTNSWFKGKDSYLSEKDPEKGLLEDMQ